MSRPGETPEDFAARCDAAAQERADAESAKIRDRLEAKRDRLEKALAQAQRRVEELDTDTRSRQATELIAGAGAVLGALLGGRQHALDGERRERSGLAPRHDRTRTAERRETAAAKVEATTDELARARAGDPRRDRGDRRALAGHGGRRSTRSRSGSRRPTSACSRRGSCGCPATDPTGGRRALATLTVGASGNAGSDGDATATTAAPSADGVVDWVNDGDTLTLRGGAKVRLVQIDAPELDSDCYGRAALQALIGLAPTGTA